MEISEIFIAKCENAKRKHNETDSLFQNEFEIDRERILFSKEFRRLNRKTQVFISGFDDHIRNRLTHTIEVGLISKTICRHLGLDEVLTTAIAYGHDVGHTPFGHVGERTLNYFMNGCGRYRDFNDVPESHRGFKHNLQGIRVVSDLERISNKFTGLNLTNFTIWGILNHTGYEPKECEFRISKTQNTCHLFHNNEKCIHSDSGLSYSFYNKYIEEIDLKTSWTIEALIVRMADEIAQRHHDLEDGLFAKIIDRKEIIDIIKNYFDDSFNTSEKRKLVDIRNQDNPNIFIYALSSFLINFLISSLVKQTETNLRGLAGKYNLNTFNDFIKYKPDIYNTDVLKIVTYSDKIASQEDKLQLFLKNRILNSHIAQSMDGKSRFILGKLITAYLDNPQQLPDNTIYLLYSRLIEKKEFEDLTKINSFEHNIGVFREKLKTDHYKTNSKVYRYTLMRTITDFLAGMTDDFAIKQYNRLFGTSNVFFNT